MKKNSISSAFPVIAPEQGPIMTGLSKREYFAAMAMQSFISMNYSDGRWVSQQELATLSIEQADELLKQLEI